MKNAKNYNTMKNRYTVLGRTAHKTHETERSLGSSFGKVIMICLLLVSFVGKVNGQCTSTFGTMLPATIQNPGATITTNTAKYFAVNVTAGTFYRITSSLQDGCFNIRMGSPTGTVIWSARSGSMFQAPTTGVAYVHHSTGACATTASTTARTITFIAQTTCTSTAFSSPWNEGFEGLAIANYGQSAILPCGWAKAGQTGTLNAAAITYNDPRTGSNYLTTYYPSQTNSDFIWTRGFNLIAGNSYNFSFYYAGDGTSGWQGDVYTGLNQNAATATILGSSFVSYATTTTSSYQQVTRTFTPTSTGTYYFGIRSQRNSTSPWYLGFDDFSLITSVACSGTPVPGNTVLSAPTSVPGGTVNLSLSTPPTGTGLTYQWQSAPTSGGTWTDIGGATAATYTATVTANTWYRCNVTCSGITGTSTASQVTLAYCTPSTTSVDGTGITNVTFGTGPVVNNTTGAEGSNYGNYSAQIGGLAQSSTATVSITYNTYDGFSSYAYTTAIYVDWNNDFDFADAGETVWTGTSAVASPTTLTATFTVPATATIGANYRMRIGGDDSGVIPAACATGLTYACFEDYTITVVTPPSCAAPTALVSSSILATSATISWTAASPAPASGYNYYVSTSATAPTAGTTPTGSTGAGVTTANLTGLSANTTYYFWVRSNCGGSGTSSWAGAGSFFTGYCTPSAVSIDDAGITNVTFGEGPIVNNTTVAEANNYGNYSAQAGGLIQGATASVAITFNTLTYDYNTVIWVDWNNDLDFADAGEEVYTGLSSATSPNTLTATFTVPATAVVGVNYRMRIGAGDDAAPSYCTTGAGYTCFEDYTITVVTPPACATPTTLVGTVTSSTTATLSWTAPASAPASGYNYYFSTSATAPTAGTTPTGSTGAGVTTANLTGLSANTTYYFWVQSNCGGGNGTSAWAGSANFYTGYCIPAATGIACTYNLISNVTLNTLANNTGGCTGGVSYNAFPASGTTTTSLYQGGTFALNITLGGTASTSQVAYWIDWNNNLLFDASEFVYVGNTFASGAIASSNIVVPAGTAPGTYRLRIKTDYYFSTTISNTSACTGLAYGETEDYTISVVALTPCAGTPSPGATTATSTQVFAGGSTTLGITTTSTDTGISYQWQSSPTGGAPWTSIGGANSSTYLATPTAATYYQCIVTCANGGATGTSTPIQITFNQYCEPIYTIGKTDGDLISNISIAGTTLSNNSGTAQTNPAYTFFTGQPNYTCDLVAANSYTVNVTVGTWGSQGIAAWIDYNDNNIFEASEKIGSTLTTIGTGTGGTPIPANHTASFTINLSCTPPLGLHRMRVRDVYFTNGPTIDPCATYAYGETEDYMVNVISGPAFTPTFTSTPAATSCVGTTVNYVANAGQTNYAWTFAGTAGTDYTLVSGGTSASNTATVTWNTGGAHSMTMNYASPLGCASAGAVSNTVTMPTTGSDISDNEAATCAVNQNGWVHFYNLSTGKLVVSINSQGQNLGDVAVSSFIDPTNALVPACTNPNPIYSTSVMQRHWVITPTIQPTTPVLVRFPFSDAELGALNFAAFNNVNGNDDISSVADIKLSRYSNGSAANVNGSASDNCGSGTSSIHAQVATGTLSSVYPQIASAGQYVTFSIPGFSEFWLHGSATSSPLPVELMNFQANCAGDGKVAVTWATASEHNSANFTIEKSRDGINWSVLTTVAGAGNSTQMINYSTVDNTASAGVNYYRLTQTDFDGASETFNIASANCGDNATTTTVKVYPNPSAGDFYIDFTSEEIIGSSVISITDARGMEVYKMNVTVEKGNNVFHIENMDVAPGMYYIKVSNGTTTSNIVKHSLR
jgi:hypothetical protein